MYGFAIASLEREKKLIGVRVIRCEDMTYKDLSISAVSILKSKCSEAVYNLESITVGEIKKLPVLSIGSNRLSKEIHTVMLAMENTYIVSNPYGQVLRLPLSEAKKLSYSNANSRLEGAFIDCNVKNDNETYLASLMFGLASFAVKDGVYQSLNSNSDEIVMPDSVTELGETCWDALNGDKMSYVRLSPNLDGLHEYQFINLNADKVVIPRLLGGFDKFSFSGCCIDKLYIQDGETVPHRLAFVKSDIKVIYVPNTVITHYRKVLMGTKTKVKVLDVNI